MITVEYFQIIKYLHITDLQASYDLTDYFEKSCSRSRDTSLAESTTDENENAMASLSQNVLSEFSNDELSGVGDLVYGEQAPDAKRVKMTK